MEKDHNQTSQSTKKISNYLTMIVLIVVALSIISLILAANAYLIESNLSCWIFSNYWFSRFDNVGIHTLPIKEASSTNEN